MQALFHKETLCMPFSSKACLLYLQYLQEWSGMHRVCIPADTLSESVALCLLYFCFVLLVLHCKCDLFIHSIFLGLLGTPQSNTTPDQCHDLQCSGSSLCKFWEETKDCTCHLMISFLAFQHLLLFQGIFSWWNRHIQLLFSCWKTMWKHFPGFNVCFVLFFFQTCLSACFQRLGISTLCYDMCILDIALFSDFLLLAIFRKLSYN